MGSSGINLPIFYSVDNDWKVPQESFGYNHDRLKSGFWNDNLDTKSYRNFPSAESPLDVMKWHLPRPEERAYNKRMQRVARLNGIKRDDLKVAMDGLRGYF